MLSLGRRQLGTLVAGAVLGIVWMLTNAAVPLVVGRTLDAGVVGADRSALVTGALTITALGALSAVAGVARHRTAVANWLQSTLRSQQLVGHHVGDNGPAVAAATTTGEVVETVATDAARIGDLFDITARGAGALVSYLAVSILLLRLDPWIGIWMTLGVPALSAVLAVIVRPLQARQVAHRAREGELTALGADTVAGLRVLRGIGGEQQFLAHYRDRSEQVRRAGVRVAGPQAALDAAHVLLPGAFVVGLTWVAGHALVDGRLTPGELVSVYGYAAFLRLPLETATDLLSRVVRARVAARRITSLLSHVKPEALRRIGVRPPAGPPWSDPASGLTLEPGLLTALVTARPDEAVAVAERLAARYGADDDRVGDNGSGGPASILVSEAEPRLFSGVLRGQLDPDGRHRDSDLLAALEAADALDVLQALPDGLDTLVQERGRAFSGGQRQRLVLARALLAAPELLVLIEPTSSVDAHTEARVAIRLRAARSHRTTLVASASPLVLDACDRVIFLSGGRVVAVGTHRELRHRNRAYRAVVIRSDEDDVLDDDGPDDDGLDDVPATGTFGGTT
jgi:ABC-type multidrug transport system fused ATPase/permease subunit